MIAKLEDALEGGLVEELHDVYVMVGDHGSHGGLLEGDAYEAARQKLAVDEVGVLADPSLVESPVAYVFQNVVLHFRYQKS